MKVEVLDSRRCALGEGMFWHPARGEAFWVDILGRRVLGEGGRAWDFDVQVSALGWFDRESLLVATERDLQRLDLQTGARATVAALNDDPALRSNDGRADPWGGFWIGTMDKGAAEGEGAVYRFDPGGGRRRIAAGVSIPNAIAFSPDRRLATWADTRRQVVWRQRLDPRGSPAAGRPPELWLDLGAEGLNPDGAVFDAEGNLWVALWGAGAVAAFAPDGREIARIALPVRQPTCPAFGGAGFDTLLVTSAAVGLPSGGLDGQTLAVRGLGVRGLAEAQLASLGP